MEQLHTSHTLSLQERLEPVLNILEDLEFIISLPTREEESDPEKQLRKNEFETKVSDNLEALNPSELAHLLEMLPLSIRTFIWNLLDTSIAADTINDLPPSLSEDLLLESSSEKLSMILAELEPEELAELRDSFEEERLIESITQTIDTLPYPEKEWVRKQLSYSDGQIGDAMGMDRLIINKSANVAQTIEMIQSQDELPEQTDKIFVCDHLQRLLGEVPLMSLLRRKANEPIVDLMTDDQISFLDTDPIEEAIQAFEHHDLISAPVVDQEKRLIGRLTIENISDIEREQADEQALARDGLKVDQDIFSPTFESARLRWSWLALNLVTAFLASGCIRLFEGAITQLVALATLMPIVASLGGNAGNQTIALFIRGLGANQINASNLKHLAIKEVSVNLINGLLWGSVLGFIGYLIYGQTGLAVVLASATALNLVLASIIGIFVPFFLHRAGKDPALGSSVILTFCTDSLGFFIFLGMAATFLL